MRRALAFLAVAAAVAGTAGPSTVGVARADESCNATYYDQGTRTASGEPFDPEAMTAAHRTLPFGTVVQVTDTDNGKVVAVRINDRGPFAPDRCIDLTRAAFERLAPASRGVIPVLLSITGTAPPPARDLVRELAARILADRRITLATGHSDLRGDDPADGASAHDDVADTAQGRPARRSSYGGAAGGTVRLSAAMLQGMLDAAAAAALDVSEIAGGPYGPRTSHARGAAFDVDGVDGRPVLFLGGAEFRVMDACRAHGATEVRYEGLHIHCGWS